MITLNNFKVCFSVFFSVNNFNLPPCIHVADPFLLLPPLLSSSRVVRQGELGERDPALWEKSLLKNAASCTYQKFLLDATKGTSRNLGNSMVKP